MSDAILNLSGLPPQRTATLYDLLARTRRDGKWQSIPVRVVSVPDCGTLTINGLRDSRYALLFSDPTAMPFSRFKLDVGDRTKYLTIYLSDPIPAPVLQSAIAFVRLNEIVARFNWTIQSDVAVVAFDIYRKCENESAFTLVHTVADWTARSCEVTGLQAENRYQWYIVARGAGQLLRKSNVVEMITPQSPVAEPNLIVNGNFETATW